MAEHVDRFVQELTPSARAIGAEYGIDPALIITQAAIESGWGKEVAGNNYFGVKSHGQPGGQSVMTHEEINGQLVPMYQDFRKYDSLEDSMRDYAKFLKDNPRYSGVFEASDLQGQIDAVAGSGYATSSKYPALLNDVSRMVARAMPAGDGPAMGYAPTPAPRSLNPALNGINASIMRPAAAPPRTGIMGTLGAGLGNLFGLAGKQAAPIMRGAQSVGQKAAPAIMRAAIGSVAGRTALIEPGLKQAFTGSPTGSPNTAIVQSYRDRGASPSQAYAATNQAASQRAIANAAPGYNNPNALWRNV